MKFVRCWLSLWVLFLIGACAPQTSPTHTTPVPTIALYEFYSPLWATCREVLPIVRGLEKEFEGRIRFVRVNILDEQNHPLMNQFGFNTTPELYLLDSTGETVGFWNDFVEADELRRAFEVALRARGESAGPD